MKLFLNATAILILIVLTTASMAAQKVLILEKRGKTKTKRFYEGDEIIYRKISDNNWETASIVQMIPEENILILDRFYVRVDEIDALLKIRNRNLTNGLSTNLFVFGTAWTAYTAIDDLVVNERETDWEAAAYAGGSSFFLGMILRLMPKTKTLKIGNKRRLRLLDLTPIPNSP